MVLAMVRGSEFLELRFLALGFAGSSAFFFLFIFCLRCGKQDNRAGSWTRS